LGLRDAELWRALARFVPDLLVEENVGEFAHRSGGDFVVALACGPRGAPFPGAVTCLAREALEVARDPRRFMRLMKELDHEDFGPAIGRLMQLGVFRLGMLRREEFRDPIFINALLRAETVKGLYDSQTLSPDELTLGLVSAMAHCLATEDGARRVGGGLA
jgi:hypothetical protein